MSSNPQHEPTMEEILASIRKIISEDQPNPSAASPKADIAPAAAPVAAEPEILDLTEEVHDDGSVAPVAAPVVDEEEVTFEAIDDLPESAEDPAGGDDDLISESTRHKVDEAFEALEPEEPPRPSYAPQGGSVEAVFVRAVQDAFQPTLAGWVGGHTAEIMDHLKPLIRQWMDDNLPAIIQAAVQKEVARAAKDRRR